MKSTVAPAKLASLLESQRLQPGYSLQQDFYIDPDIYRHEMENIFFADWIYACHVSQLAEVGDCQTIDVDSESVIVCRDKNQDIRAFANVCRHRGSRICATGASKNRRLSCPYHAWTYELNGDLLSARMMPEDFDKSSFGLHKVAAEVFCGFVFINLADEPTPFATVKEQLHDVLSVFDFENTRVVHHESHPINANWKLVYENYYECYHCSPAHKEYAASHSLALDDERRVLYQQKLAERAKASGISTDLVAAEAIDPEGNTALQFYYKRYALLDGYLTGSEDGTAVAPLLGHVKAYDGGASDVQIGNLTYLLVYSDYCVLYRFTPRAVDQTDAELFWFVRKDAEPKAIDSERMHWLWHVTTIADKDIIERNQQGVVSRYYQPGPYSPMEEPTRGLIDWYLQAIAS